jgi:hypothetical protein
MNKIIYALSEWTRSIVATVEKGDQSPRFRRTAGLVMASDSTAETI